MSNACDVCSGMTPKWIVIRDGDQETKRACDHHLLAVCTDLQRDGEPTTLRLTVRPRMADVAASVRETNRSIRDTISKIGAP